MNGIMRASLATITIVGLAGVAVLVSNSRQRIDPAVKRAQDDFQVWFLDGPIGRVVARYYAPFNAWLYAIYARALELQPDDEVLDVACGSGVFLAKHAKHVSLIAGLDRSRAMIDQALRENATRIADGSAEFVVGDAAALPWDDETFSVVTSNDTECFEAKVPQALREMYRVLKPGGRAVIGNDRRGLLEAAGFDRVSGRRVIGKYLTTGYKDRPISPRDQGTRTDGYEAQGPHPGTQGGLDPVVVAMSAETRMT
jgi:SAM-dependent methyltransferase